MILSTIYVCHRARSPLFYLLAVAFLGARQHALLILMHDGVHYRLFRNRWLNDWVTEMLLAWPNLISARAYRRNHFAHHLYLNTDKDPDWARKQENPDWSFPKGWKYLLRLLVRDLSGLGAIAFLKTVRSVSARDIECRQRIHIFAVWVLLRNCININLDERGRTVHSVLVCTYVHVVNVYFSLAQYR